MRRDWLSLIRGWRGDISTGHTSTILAFMVAIVQEFRGAELHHVALWLGAGTGAYSVVKTTEMICGRPSPAAAGTSVVPTPLGADNGGGANA